MWGRHSSMWAGQSSYTIYFECVCWVFCLSLLFFYYLFIKLLLLSCNLHVLGRNTFVCVLNACAHVVHVAFYLKFHILTIWVPIKSCLQNLNDNSWVKPRLRHGSGNPNNCDSVPPPSHSAFFCFFQLAHHLIYGNDSSCCPDKCKEKWLKPIRENLYLNVLL